MSYENDAIASIKCKTMYFFIVTQQQYLLIQHSSKIVVLTFNIVNK